MTTTVPYGIPVLNQEDQIGRTPLKILFSGPSQFHKDVSVKGTLRCDKLEVTDPAFAPAQSRLPARAQVVASLDDADEDVDLADPVVCVDIARCLFYTRLSTLKRLPYFQKALTYNPKLRKTQMVDRDPALFDLILRFLRCGVAYDTFVKGWCPNDLVLFANELVFYGLEPVLETPLSQAVVPFIAP